MLSRIERLALRAMYGVGLMAYQVTEHDDAGELNIALKTALEKLKPIKRNQKLMDFVED